MHRELRTLSTGELRKVFLVRALLRKPELLILDEPLNGLDMGSKEEFMKIIGEVMEKGIRVVLITHRYDEFPEQITHVMIMENGHIFAQGAKECILKEYPDLFDMYLDFRSPRDIVHPEGITHFVVVLSKRRYSGSDSVNKLSGQNNGLKKIIIAMKNVTVTFDGNKILDNISWEMREGDNWAILGPNGAGKTTLVRLITGDVQQAYANKITLFGIPKDKLSLWEIKEKIGIVSPGLHLQYHGDIKVYDVILSGYFDSIGLFRSASEGQRLAVEKWIKTLRLDGLVSKYFSELSFGQKRLVLTVRAVVKSPQLLILDEPTHGLDGENRMRVLELINTIGIEKKSQLILVTHHDEEILPCMTNILKLEKGITRANGVIRSGGVLPELLECRL